VTEVRFMTLNR